MHPFHIAGTLAISVALYHGVVGHHLIVEAALPAELGWFEPSFHIGTMGWLTGGALLLQLPRLEAGRGIAATLVPLYLLPGLGNAAMHGFRPDVGWIALLLVAVFTMIGFSSTRLPE